MKSSFGKLIHEDHIMKEFLKTYNYTKDPIYELWESQLYDPYNKFSFEKTLKFCGLKNNIRLTEAKEKWLNYIRLWNMTRDERNEIDSSEYTTLGYVAVTYAYIVYPYIKKEPNEERSTEITEFQAKLINICIFHETGENLTCFEDYDMLIITDPPDDPDEFELYLHEQYNSSAWFLTFLIFLSNYGFKLHHKGAKWSGSI